MKKILFAAFVFAFASCTKDDTPKCNLCTMLFVNAEPYDYKVSFQNWSGAPAPFRLKPGDSKTITAPTGQLVTVVGDLQSGYAHSDLKSPRNSFRYAVKKHWTVNAFRPAKNWPNKGRGGASGGVY